MRGLYCLFLLFTGFVIRSQSVFQNILISTASDPEEVTIAINPRNTNEIIAGANLASYYYSHDKGYSWERKVLKCPAYNVWGDPVVFWDTAQTAYYMHLSFPNPKITPGGSWVDRIVLNRSTDHGLTFPDCYAFGKNDKKVQDKHWAAVDPKTNYIHTTWTQFDKYESKDPLDSSIIRYSYSKDGGVNWSEPKRISHYAGDCLDSDNTVEGAVPCVGPNSEIYVAWAGPKGLVFNKSFDAGNTWMDVEQVIDSIPGGWDYSIEGLFRANGMPFTTCDLSNGPHRGRIYICWGDAKHGTNNKDVFLTYSDDQGKTWADRILITYYPNHKNQFMPHFTIDQSNGNLYFFYYDRKNFLNGGFTDVTLCASKDGGKTFQYYKVNQSSFKPSKDIFFGDYIGVSAANGIIRPIWMQMDDQKKLAVYTAIIADSLLNRYKEGQRILFPDKDIKYANKVSVNYSLTEGGITHACIYDPMDPKLEKVLFKDKMLASGEHTLKIDFKKLKLTQKTYVLMIYAYGRQNYIWIYKE